MADQPPSDDDQRAADLKQQGNEAFVAERWADAERLYSEGLALAPGSHVLLGNRSAARAHLQQWAAALEDADAAVAAAPEWLKGYHRRATALTGLGRLREAAEAYGPALEREPGNQWLQRTQRGAFAAAVRADAAADVRDAADWAERWRFIPEMPVRLATLATFWNLCDRSQRHLAFSRLIDMISGGSGSPVAEQMGPEYMLDLPMANYAHIAVPEPWTRWFGEQDSISRVQIFEDMYSTATEEERTLILRDLRFFIGGARAAAEAAQATPAPEAAAVAAEEGERGAEERKE